MASSFSKILGSIVITISVGWFVFLALYSSLTATTMGIGIVVTLLGLWLLTDPDVTHPSSDSSSSSSSSGSRLPWGSGGSSGSNPGSGGGSPGGGSTGGSSGDSSPEGSDPGGSPGGSGPGGSTSGGGSGSSSGGSKPLLNIATPNNLQAPIRASNINLEIDCQDQSGAGLEALNIMLPDFGARKGKNLGGVSSTREILTLADVIGADPELNEGDAKIEAELYDKSGSQSVATDVLKISNKNGRNQNSGMDPEAQSEVEGTEGEVESEIEELEAEKNLLKKLGKMDKEELEVIKQAFNALGVAEENYRDVINHIESIESLEGADTNAARDEIRQEEVAHLREIESDFKDARNALNQFEEKVGYIKRDVEKERQYEDKLEKLEGQVEDRHDDLTGHVNRIENALDVELNI